MQMSSIAQAKSSDLKDMEAILLSRMYSSHLTAIQHFFESSITLLANG